MARANNISQSFQQSIKFSSFFLFPFIFFFCFSSLLKAPATWPGGQSSERISFARCLVKEKHTRKKKKRKENSMALIRERSSHSFALPCSLASPWFRVIGSTFVQWRILNSSSLELYNYGCSMQYTHRFTFRYRSSRPRGIKTCVCVVRGVRV